MATRTFHWMTKHSVFMLVIILSQIGGGNSSWSQPETIPGYNHDASPPVLIADSNGTIHAFSSQWVGEDTPALGIMYNRWSFDKGWTLPVDIILSPIKEARIIDAFLDSKGIVHLIFWGGDNIAAWVYYTKAQIEQVADPRSWQSPIIIASQAGDPASGQIIVSEDGNIDVFYHGESSGNGVYHIFSDGEGVTWSDPVMLFSSLEDYAPFISRINVIGNKEEGGFHVIWNTFNVVGQGREIFYAKYKDDLEQTIGPSLLFETRTGLGVMNPVIVDYKNVLFVFFNNPPKIAMRRSFDRGLTWDQTEVLFRRHIGVNGTVSAVIDGDLGFHLFFGQRIPGSPDIHGMWHSQFINNRWIEPEAVVKGPLVVDELGTAGFDPYEARAIISRGNTILVTWQTDFQSKGNGVWYSFTELEKIKEQPTTLPTLTEAQIPTIVSTVQEQNTDKVQITSYPKGVLPFTNEQRNSVIKPTQLILISMIPVLAILLILFLIRLKRE